MTLIHIQVFRSLKIVDGLSNQAGNDIDDPLDLFDVHQRKQRYYILQHIQEIYDVVKGMVVSQYWYHQMLALWPKVLAQCPSMSGPDLDILSKLTRFNGLFLVLLFKDKVQNARFFREVGACQRDSRRLPTASKGIYGDYFSWTRSVISNSTLLFGITGFFRARRRRGFWATTSLLAVLGLVKHKAPHGTGFSPFFSLKTHRRVQAPFDGQKAAQLFARTLGMVPPFTIMLIRDAVPHFHISTAKYTRLKKSSWMAPAISSPIGSTFVTIMMLLFRDEETLIKGLRFQAVQWMAS